MAFYDADVTRCESAAASENWRFIAQLVRSAAHSVGCPMAVLFQYEADRDRLTPSASVGIDTVQAYDVPLSQLWPAQADNRTLEPLTTIDAECGNSWPLPRADDGQALSMRLAVLVPVIVSDGSIAGALFLGNTELHARSSRAQIYVLKTHGIQIGRQMTWSQPAMVREPVRGSSDPERLRLLESIVANAKDAVLITEAAGRSMIRGRELSTATGLSRAIPVTAKPRCWADPRVSCRAGIPTVPRSTVCGQRW